MVGNDKNLEIVSEILQGVTVVDSSFGSLYFRHLSQAQQREAISESKLFEREALSKGLLSKEQSLREIIHQEMWSEENEQQIKNLNTDIENLKKIKDFALQMKYKSDLVAQDLIFGGLKHKKYYPTLLQLENLWEMATLFPHL